MILFADAFLAGCECIVCFENNWQCTVLCVSIVSLANTTVDTYTYTMKTPERWRPSHVVPPWSVFSPHRPPYTHYKPWCDITPWRRLVLWCHSMMSQDVMTSQCGIRWRWIYTGQPIRRFAKLRFSTLRPWPLTYDLDLQTHSRYHRGTPLHQILGLYVKRFSRESAYQQMDRQTEGQMDRQDRFYTLDRWRGREKRKEKIQTFLLSTTLVLLEASSFGRANRDFLLIEVVGRLSGSGETALDRFLRYSLFL